MLSDLPLAVNKKMREENKQMVIRAATYCCPLLAGSGCCVVHAGGLWWPGEPPSPACLTDWLYTVVGAVYAQRWPEKSRHTSQFLSPPRCLFFLFCNPHKEGNNLV